MIPVGDSVPRKRRPYATSLLLVLNVGVFVWEAFLGTRLERVIAVVGMVPAEVLEALLRGAWPEALVPLVASTFLHGNALHLASNMLFLWVFGRAVEDRVGHAPYLLFYALAALLAGLSQAFIQPDSTLPMIGASGAVAGVLGAYFALYPVARVSLLLPLGFFFWTLPVPAFIVLGLWFGLQLFHALVALSLDAAGAAGVAWFAHLGGFATGILFASAIPPVLRPAIPEPRRLRAMISRPVLPSAALAGMTQFVLGLLAARLGLGLLRFPDRGIVSWLYALTDPVLGAFNSLLLAWGLRLGPVLTVLVAMLALHVLSVLCRSVLELGVRVLHRRSKAGSGRRGYATVGGVHLLPRSAVD